MKRTNIHLREDQRENIAFIARARKTNPAIEVREAVDERIASHRKDLLAGKRLPKI